MLASRTTARAAARTLRAPVRTNARQIRYASTNQKAPAAGASSGLVGGITGGALVFLAGYGYYHFSGTKSLVTAAQTTKSKFDSLSSNLSSKAPSSSAEALKYLRETATSYASFIPGGKSYVDSAFNDLDSIREEHGEEVEKIVNDAYEGLKNAGKKDGMSVEGLSKSWGILEDAMVKLGKLAGDEAERILDNHPQIKEKVGGGLDQLKGMKDVAPDAKKEIDEMWKRVGDIVKGGVGVGSIEEVRKLIQDTVEKVKKMGDEAWEKGLEQAKPILDKNPQVKKFVEQNANSLKQGNVSQVFEKVKDAASSGKTDDLEKYVKDVGEKAKKSGLGQGIEQYAKMIPGGDQILPKLQKLQEVAQKHGDEAEEILKSAYKDVQEVLQKRIGEVEKLAEKAGKDAKK